MNGVSAIVVPPSFLVAAGLTVGGWITMILSVGFVTGLLGWCIYKVIATPDSPEHVHSQLDIDPGDRED